MKIKHLFVAFLAIAALLATSSPASAAVTFDPATGSGFVGKGDVQLIYGWNNKQLQDNAHLVQIRSTTVSERSWECQRFNSQGTEFLQERERTTESTQLVTKIDRVRNQITGFLIDGYTGTASTSTAGPALNSCPAAPSTWVLSSPAGDPVFVSGGLQVSIDGINWFALN